MGVEAEFGIIVVFDDAAVRGFLGPLQQLPPPGGGGDDARGEVMTGGAVENLGVAQAVRADTKCIHGNADAFHAAGGVDLTDFPVARIFHGIALVPAQKLDEQIVKKIRALGGDIVKVDIPLSLHKEI